MSGPRSYSTSPISGGARYGSGARKTGRPGSGSSGWPTTGSRNRESFIRGQRVASPLDTQGGSRMPELGPYGSVRGARGNSRPYRESERRTVRTTRLTRSGLHGTDELLIPLPYLLRMRAREQRGISTRRVGPIVL